MQAMFTDMYMYLSNRPPPQTDHSLILIALFGSQTIAHNDIVTP